MASTKQKQYPKTSTVKFERTCVIVLERFNLSFDLNIEPMKEHPQRTVAGILRHAGLKGGSSVHGDDHQSEKTPCIGSLCLSARTCLNMDA
jgi:hypothetical protein